MRKMIQLLAQIAELLEAIAADGLGGGGAAPLSGAGAPQSGVGGLEAVRGTEYYDTSVDPPTIYKQTAADETDPVWVSLITGDAT